MEMMIWNVILSAIVAMMGFIFKNAFDELSRLGILMNRTREEIARNHITREEYSRDLEKLGDRFDAAFLRLEGKLDGLVKTGTQN
jgi:uncharacterized membrane protein